MAKPVYFYGIHAVQSLLQHRGMDGLALFIQDTKQADSNVVTMVQLAQQYGISVQIAGKDKLTKLAEGIEGGSDGLDAASPKEFIASGWAGIIYYIYPDGFKETLLDTRGEKMNTADIVFDPVSRIIYVPTFWKNKVVAYELK